MPAALATFLIFGGIGLAAWAVYRRPDLFAPGRETHVGGGGGEYTGGDGGGSSGGGDGGG
jgi:hypothetical protein